MTELTALLPLIVIIGSSNGSAHVMPWGPDSDPLLVSWVQRLAVGEVGKQARILNLSCGGWRLFDWLPGADRVDCRNNGTNPGAGYGVRPWQDYAAQIAAADIAVITVGANDAWGQRDVEDWASDYITLIDNLSAAGVQRIVAVPVEQFHPAAFDPPGGELFQQAYAAAVCDICEEYDEVVCGPNLSQMSVGRWGSDGVHFREDWHAEVADLLDPIVLGEINRWKKDNHLNRLQTFREEWMND